MEKQIDDVLKLENQLCFPLYAASREVIKKYRPLLDALDITYTQYITMMVFWEYKKINVKDLGKKLFLDSGTLTPVLKSLEAKGLVRRYRSTDDERVLTVEITKKGVDLKEKATHIPAALTDCIQLDAKEAVQLYQLLYKILNKTADKTSDKN
ncbi:MAG: MarR family transcriptional regulator [Clostridia bacterium]|nr:MarR family transcriptional regulator [Clostridia bacterium]